MSAPTHLCLGVPCDGCLAREPGMYPDPPMELELGLRSMLPTEALTLVVQNAIETVSGIVQSTPVDVVERRTSDERIVTVRVAVIDAKSVPTDPEAHPEDSCLTGDVLAAVLTGVLAIRGVTVRSSGAEWVIA